MKKGSQDHMSFFSSLKSLLWRSHIAAVLLFKGLQLRISLELSRNFSYVIVFKIAIYHINLIQKFSYITQNAYFVSLFFCFKLVVTYWVLWLGCALLLLLGVRFTPFLYTINWNAEAFPSSLLWPILLQALLVFAFGLQTPSSGSGVTQACQSDFSVVEGYGADHIECCHLAHTGQPGDQT